MVPSKSLLRVQIKRAIVTKERQNFRIKYRWHQVKILFFLCSPTFALIYFIIASHFFFLLVLQTYAVPLLMQKLQCVAWQKERRSVCVSALPQLLLYKIELGKA